ncbi:f482a17b-82a5-4f69-aa70-9a9126ce4094 [Sclerotinia trifoliorum]|uniref:F482a17b-82a5-4f69-aa70-9a9126ce4094 n=1 Tax=Sclerotinia trifoliorum TaxID=28548 RepID=A0A8H2ZT96_9HELO|nr:f482a17b-82a5-4f69-aa70-9a9126ce4094 [Sclerotinia trifoliorum]
MEQSPPKRVTRARAAAKSTKDTVIKTARIAPTASKSANISRGTTSTKRKTRADDDEEEQNEELAEETKPEPKSTRGRPRKAAQLETEVEETMAPAKVTRGRPKKTTVEALVPQAARSLRGRTKKDEVESQAESEPTVTEEPAKKVTRTRAPSATISRAMGPKKRVKFEEPDKENILPPTRAKPKAAETATGLRAKPVRKLASSATASTRATRARAKPGQDEKVEKPLPLSPKKATQVNANKGQSSEDELSTTVKTPMKSLMKSPVKPPGSIFDTAKKIDFSTSLAAQKPIEGGKLDFQASTMMSPARRPPQTAEKKLDIATSFADKPSMEPTQIFNASTMTSPARRPPQSSPFKETLKLNAQRFEFGHSMRSPFKPNLFAPEPSTTASPLKTSLLQSPARRPQSPTKVDEAGSPTRNNQSASIFAATPKVSTFKISRFETPRTLMKSAIRPGPMFPPIPSSAVKNNVSNGSPLPKETKSLATPVLEFSGRLSSILPRSADPAFSSAVGLPPQIDEPVGPVAADIQEQFDGLMTVDNTDEVVDTIEAQSTTPPCSPPTHIGSSFQLREEKNSIDDSDSEDELASVAKEYSPTPLADFPFTTNNFASPATPAKFDSTNKTPKMATVQSSARYSRRFNQEKIGFTPLAKQLSDWMAASSEESSECDDDLDRPISPTRKPAEKELHVDMGKTAESPAVASPAVASPAVASPAKSSYFEDEMKIRDELNMAENDSTSSDEVEAENSEPEFNDMELLEEDIDLAEEADELSMLDPEAFEANDEENEESQEENVEESQDESSKEGEYEATIINNNFQEHVVVPEPTPSEPSQEYGDENEVPIDPALLAYTPQSPATPIFTTPKRVLTERTFHTVAKVPLKDAHETPMRPLQEKRSASISKLSFARPSSPLSRNNTVTPYSPSKSTPKSKKSQKFTESAGSQEFTTPTKSETVTWFTNATPARTPHPDLSAALLKGAVVFVDVHTTEGADASGLFTELLTQMGAKCVKTWSWNPNSDDGSKIGITHIVFKDGGKRTLEKARQTGGVVSCVGVGWVLDCERENQWLDEAAYAVDTSMVPRGGARRRKSMEPRALANFNGTLVPSTVPAKSAYSTLTYPDTTPLTLKSKRRESVQWQRSPIPNEEGDVDELGEDNWMLSPVPATPAPETISAYAEEGLWGGETPGAQTPYFFKKDKLVQMTAPGGNKKFVNFGEGESSESGNPGDGLSFLRKDKEQSVMMRLMAARRKSLQWAPKIGSPLARRFDGGL